MKEQTRISVLASVLLAVFLPMVIISSVHVHHVDSVDNDLCVKCVRHVPHATHFSAHIVKFEHCLFCHFMSLVFMATDCPMDANKAPVKPWVYNKDFDIPAGQRKYNATVDIPIPADIDPGDYHFMIRLTDKAGWQQLKSVAIKIVE